MDIEFATALAAAAIWLAAGAVADGLPRPRTALALGRRTGALLCLTLAGLAVLAAPAIGAAATPGTTAADRIALGLALPTVPAAFVALLTVRRLRRLRAGAGAFVAAPDTPAPPTLVAGAAHPMIVLPVQVTGLATLPAVAIAGGSVPLTGPGTMGLVLPAAGLAVVMIGVRHALRHSRLAESAVTVRPASPRSAGVLHV